MSKDSIKTVATYLSKQARMLARSCADEDRDAALAFADALGKHPDRVLQSIEVKKHSRRKAA